MYEQLYEQNRGLLWTIAQRYRGACEQNRAVALEDLVQSGFIGLVAAARSYNKESGKSWSVHAKWYVMREMRRALGLHRGEAARVDALAISLDSVMETEDGAPTALVELLPDNSLPDSDEALLLEELRTGVRLALNALADPRQQEIVERCAIGNQTVRQAAEALGVTLGRAIQLYGRAMASLARDRRLRAFADLDERTHFHAHKGVRAFMNDRTSVTEAAALWRIEQHERQKEVSSGEKPARLR